MPRPKSNLEELLLTRAAELIATEGLDALSLRELARRAGVSRAAPYHYFTDKAELVARVGALGFERLGERIAAATASSADPWMQLRAGLLAYIDLRTPSLTFFSSCSPARCSATRSAKAIPCHASPSPATPRARRS